MIRQDLIEKELEYHRNQGYQFRHVKLSNKFIDWLFNRYFCYEFIENYYDDFSGDFCESDFNEEYRLTLNNWQDPYFEGAWNLTQPEVDKLARKWLKLIRRCLPQSRERIYFAEKDRTILIYWYGRDLDYHDFWFTFKRREKGINSASKYDDKYGCDMF